MEENLQTGDVEQPAVETQEIEQQLEQADTELEVDNPEAEEQESALENEGESEKPKKNKLQARFDEITREKKQAQEEAAKLKQELEFLRENQNKKLDVPVELKKPDDKDYDDYQSFHEAEINYYKELGRQQAKQELEYKSKATTYQNTVKTAKEKYADFDEVVSKADSYGVVASATLAEAITTSEFGALLTYEIAKDPLKAVELSRLAVEKPIQFVKEIGKIEARLSSSNSVNKPVLNTKPKPISPVGGSSEMKNIDNMSIEEFVAMRKSQGAKWYK